MKIIAAFLIIFCFQNSSAQLTFVKEYIVQANSFGKAIVKTHDGNLVLGGTTISNVGDTDIVLLKINPFGDTLWTKIYNGIDDDDLVGMVSTRDSGIALLAISEGTSSTRLLKTDSTGNIQWSKTFQGFKSFSFIQTLDNGFCLCGTRFYAVGPVATNSIIIKTNNNGDTLWTKTRGYGSYIISARQIIQNEDSTYTIAELREQLDIGVPGFLKLSPQGEFISKTISYPAPEEYNDISFCKTSDSSYIMSGDGWEAFNGYEFVKFNSGMTCNWAKSISPPGYSMGTYSMLQALDGNIVMVQTSQVLKIDTAGNQIWNQRIVGLNSKSKNSIVELADSSLALCATMSNHVCLVRFDSNGNNCLSNSTTLNIGAGIGGCQLDTVEIEMQASYSISNSLFSNIGSQANEQTICQQFSGIEVSQDSYHLLLTPNPTTSFLKIQTTQGIDHIELFNLLGKQVGTWHNAGGKKEMEIDLTKLSAGIYFLQASDGESVWRGKVIKE